MYKERSIKHGGNNVIGAEYGNPFSTGHGKKPSNFDDSEGHFFRK